MTSIRNNPAFPRDLWPAAAILALVLALCWGWIAAMAVDMYGPMSGASSWMMARAWDIPHRALLFAMWAVMMIGMMLPSIAPGLLLGAAASRRIAGGGGVTARLLAFAAGYLAAWALFSLFATVLQLALAGASLLSPMMVLRSHSLGAAVMLVAGVYQFTPWKKRCLACCRRPGDSASGFRGGFRNGLSCVGCCWALMLLLFVGGVMNLWWCAALTIFVALEKLLSPRGARCHSGRSDRAPKGGDCWNWPLWRS